MCLNNSAKTGSWILWVGIVVVALLWGLNWWLPNWALPMDPFTAQPSIQEPQQKVITEVQEKEHENILAAKGQFGDRFGAVNALFSGLAFAFLAYTIWLQREELRLQREELKLTREELKRQADEIAKTVEIQKETSSIQREQLRVTQEQIESEKKRHTLAKFVLAADLTGSMSTYFDLHTNLINIGATASNVKFSCEIELTGITTFARVLTNEVIPVSWRNTDFHTFPQEVPFEIQFNDLEGITQRQQFLLCKVSETDLNKAFVLKQIT